MSYWRSKLNILVIEDDPKWRIYLRDTLTSIGYDVKDVDDYISAIQALESGISFKLIILDMELKQKDFSPYSYKGWKILEEIKKYDRHATTPTLVITGHSEEYLTWRDKKEIRANSFVEKQKFNEKDFLELVQRLISNP